MVTAFANETGDAALDPIGRMAADWITEGLVRTGFVQVLERDIGAPADALVSGRVYQAGDSIWLQARITQPGDGTILRALDKVGTAGTHPSAALESLRQRVLGAMGVLYDPRLTGYASATLRPPSFDAYREFAAGMEAFSFPRDLDGAADRFLRAAELDPEYILPRLWLAWTWILASEYVRADSMGHALRSAREGMSPWERAWHDRISADLAGDRQAAFRAAQRMVKVAPRSAAVIALANAAVDLNRPSLAVAAILDAGIENLAPEQEYPWFILTSSYHTLGQYQLELEATDQAIQQVGLAWGFLGPGVPALAALGRFDELEQRLNELRSVELEEGLPGGPTSVQTAITELRAHGFGGAAHTVLNRTLNARWGFPDDETGSPEIQLIRLRVHYELGNWAEAEHALASIPIDDADDLELRATTGLLAARRGDRAGAEQVLEDLSGLNRPYLFGEHTFWRARIAAVLGAHEKAVDLLRQTFAEGQWARGWYGVQHLRDFDPLRELPSFRAFAAPQ
jgi:tetratricopeptide (TPR) repeat protein